MLGNQWRTIIKTTHSKVKHVMKAFNTTNDTIKLSVTVEGFDKTLQDLKTALLTAQTVTAITLGCQVLYIRIPSLTTAKKKKEAVRYLKWAWKDSKANSLIPPCVACVLFRQLSGLYAGSAGYLYVRVLWTRVHKLFRRS